MNSCMHLKFSKTIKSDYNLKFREVYSNEASFCTKNTLKNCTERF